MRERTAIAAAALLLPGLLGSAAWAQESSPEPRDPFADIFATPSSGAPSGLTTRLGANMRKSLTVRVGDRTSTRVDSTVSATEAKPYSSDSAAPPPPTLRRPGGSPSDTFNAGWAPLAQPQ